MCNPAIAVAAIIISGLMQMQASNRAAQGAQRRAEYENELAANNAEHAQNLADDARQRGTAEVARERLRVLNLIGEQRVGIAGHNVLLGEGTAVDFLADTAAVGKLDELTILANAEREAIGFETQGVNFRGRGQLSLLRGADESAAQKARGRIALVSSIGSAAAAGSSAGG